MNRNEYLHSVEEGFIKDTVKKGWEKIKSLFRIGMRKIKNFIAIFDADGNIFPVVSPQAVIDRFADSRGIKVYAPASMSESVVAAGGVGCDSKAEHIEDDGIYNYGPDGKEFSKWVSEEKFKESQEYQNLMSIPKLIKEHYDCTDEEAQEIFEGMFDPDQYLEESWEGVSKERVKYVDHGELSGLREIDTKDFERIIDKMVDERITNGGKVRVRADGKVGRPSRNMLVFGAPGIGKSTIPNQVIDKYNAAAGDDPSKQISLISINCSLISEGDFMMPTMPKENDVIAAINKFSKAFPQSKEYIDGLSAEQTDDIARTIAASGQFKSSDAPKSWLPSYKPTGDKNIDIMLDAYANGGVYEDSDGYTHKTGNGGIILFDEFLRANASVFSQLMNFFLERRLQDWKLGSKWVIIACSNRPCDDGEVAKVWKDWNDSPASKDRQERMYQLVPDPELWKNWIRTKGVDELLLDFIFEKDSMVGDEYPRWHSAVRRGTGDAKQVKPIMPRTWEAAFNAINNYELDNDLDDISQMTTDEIDDCLGGIFDVDFVAEITTWLRDHMNKVDLDAIMENPKEVYLPKKFVNDPAQALILVQNLLKEFEGRYKEHPGDCSDEQLANIIAWLGINYKGDMVAVQNFVEELVKHVFKDNSEYKFAKFVKTFQMLEAAYPPREIEDDVKEYESLSEDEGGWPEGSMDIVKDLMREYFPWRIDGDKIKYYDDLSVDDE